MSPTRPPGKPAGHRPPQPTAGRMGWILPLLRQGDVGAVEADIALDDLDLAHRRSPIATGLRDLCASGFFRLTSFRLLTDDVDQVAHKQVGVDQVQTPVLQRDAADDDVARDVAGARA